MTPRFHVVCDRGDRWVTDLWVHRSSASALISQGLAELMTNVTDLASSYYREEERGGRRSLAVPGPWGKSFAAGIGHPVIGHRFPVSNTYKMSCVDDCWVTDLFIGHQGRSYQTPARRYSWFRSRRPDGLVTLDLALITIKIVPN